MGTASMSLEISTAATSDQRVGLLLFVYAIDLFKTFDLDPRYVLNSKILRTDISPNFKKWLVR